MSFVENTFAWQALNIFGKLTKLPRRVLQTWFLPRNTLKYVDPTYWMAYVHRHPLHIAVPCLPQLKRIETKGPRTTLHHVMWTSCDYPQTHLEKSWSPPLLRVWLFGNMYMMTLTLTSLQEWISVVFTSFLAIYQQYYGVSKLRTNLTNSILIRNRAQEWSWRDLITNQNMLKRT